MSLNKWQSLSYSEVVFQVMQHSTEKMGGESQLGLLDEIKPIWISL